MLGFNIDALVMTPVHSLLDKVIGFIPTLLGAMIILIGGWIVAKVVRILVEKTLDVIKFEDFSKKSGMSDFLKKGDIGHSASEIICGTVYHVCMVMVLLMVLNAVGGVLPTEVVDSFVLYIPIVLTALFVLLVGIMFARFVSLIVRASAKNVNLPRPDVLEDISRWAFIIFALTVSLKTLGLHFLFEGTMFTILIGGIVLGLALKFGFNGGQDRAGRYVRDLLKK